MRSFIFYLMVVLMIVWTAVFIMELSYVYFSSTVVAAMAGTEQSVADFGVFYDTIRAGFWGPEAAARVALGAKAEGTPLPPIVRAAGGRNAARRCLFPHVSPCFPRIPLPWGG